MEAPWSSGQGTPYPQTQRPCDRAARVDLTSQRVLEAIRRIALSDIGTLLDNEDKQLPVHDRPLEAHAAVASLKVVTRQAFAGDGSVVTVSDVKLWDKIRALELAATYLGLLKTQMEHSGGIDLVKRLQAARQRGRAA